jgi:Ser/Thr protein kinase RdoA (MazF antagonist)
MPSDESRTFWLKTVQTLLRDVRAEILASDDETAKVQVTPPDGRDMVMKAVRGASEKRANLRFQWQALMMFRDEIDFPGPQAISRHCLDDGAEVYIIGYLPGHHPQFESDDDFHIFGATLGRLHLLSKGKRLKDAPMWDLPRIARHYANPRLLRLMNESERTIVMAALERFGPPFQAQLNEGVWSGLVHSDSHRHNVVIDGGRGSLIDLGECGYGPLLWDLGVAVADSAVDAPERGEACRQNLVAGYLSVAPQAASSLDKSLPVFEAMRSLEVITWPVSDWSPQRLAEDEDEARENVEVSVRHLEALLAAT